MSTVTGNTYKAEVQYICKKMAGGGCVIRTNCILSFTEQEVEVSYETIVNCTPKEREANYTSEDEPSKRYTWSESNNILTIDNFKEYGTFTHSADTLIAAKSKNGEALVFLKK